MKSFKYRLNLCVRVGGKTITPFLKSHQYRDLEKVPKEAAPYDFDQIIDMKLIEYAYQSWKKTGKILKLNKNFVKYRTNYLQQKKINEETRKIVTDSGIIPRVFYVIPQINNYLNIPMQEQEIEQASGKHHVLSYIDEESDDSDYSDSE